MWANDDLVPVDHGTATIQNTCIIETHPLETKLDMIWIYESRCYVCLLLQTLDRMMPFAPFLIFRLPYDKVKFVHKANPKWLSKWLRTGMLKLLWPLNLYLLLSLHHKTCASILSCYVYSQTKKSEQMSIGIIERRYAVNIYLIHGTTYVSQYSLVLIIAFTFNIL